MEIFLLYVWTRLDALHLFLGQLILGGLGALMFLFCMAAILTPVWGEYVVEKQIDPAIEGRCTWALTSIGRRIKRFLFTCVVLLLCLNVVKVLTPTSKDLAYIVAGYATLEIAKTPEAKVLGQALYNKAMELLATPQLK